MKSNESKTASAYFSVVKDKKGDIVELLLNGKKYKANAKIIVPRKDLERVKLNQMPEKLILDLPEDNSYGLHIQAIQFTKQNVTEVVCLYRLQRSRYVDPVGMATIEAGLYDLMQGRAKRIKDVKILIRHDDGDWIVTAFVVPMTGKTFGEAFDKTETWFSDLVEKNLKQFKTTKAKRKP